MQPESTESPRLSRQELSDQLSRGIELRSSQDQVLWSIFGFFGATNAVLLVALFQDGRFPADPWLVLVVVVAGVAVAVAWHLIQRRAIGYIERHEALMARIEQELRVPSTLSVTAEVTGGVRARCVMVSYGWFSGALWVAVLLIFLGKRLACI